MIENKEVLYIDFNLMRTMCHPIAMTLFDSKVDPMTDFDDHERALLESALNNPRQTYEGKDLYPSLFKKAAILYYSLIKNHPFKNGNKRSATATLLAFLYINNVWTKNILEGNKKKEIEDYLVTLAKRVASSIGTKEKEEFLKEIEDWLEAHTVFQ
jgi:death-on-curing protein